MRILLSIFILSILISCGNDPRAKMPVEGSLGEKVNSNDSAIDVPKAISLMNNNSEPVEVTVSGTIHSYCRTEGCWLTLKNPIGDALFVEVENKAFTLPKKIDGHEALISGRMVKINKDGQDMIKLVAKGIVIK